MASPRLSKTVNKERVTQKFRLSGEVEGVTPAPDFMRNINRTSGVIGRAYSGGESILPPRSRVQRTVSEPHHAGDYRHAKVQGRGDTDIKDCHGVLYEDEAKQTSPNAELKTVHVPQLDGRPKIESEISIADEIVHSHLTDCASIVQQAQDPGCKSQSQLESDADAKQRRINRVFMNLKVAEKVGVCFMVDCTASMGPWINEIKGKIKSWSEQLHANHTHLELHLAFVRYTDYDLPLSIRTTTLDFTTDIQEFYRFVDKIRAEDGGDEAEDVFGGLDAMLRLNWQKVGTKVLIHIADAPCHGAQYHNLTTTDDYPKGDPGGLKLDDLMKSFADKQIAYHFGYIKKSHTLAMIKAFDSSLLAQSNRLLSIQQFDSRQTSDLAENVFQTITTTIGATCEALTAESKRRLHDFTIDETIPTWDNISVQQVLVTPPPQPGAIAMLEHPKTPMSIKIAPEPFGVGNQRLAYHALDVTQNSHIVIKRSKWSDARSNCLKRCLETANVHAIAAKFSAQFNEEKPFIVSSSEIRFIPVGVMQIKDDGKEQNFTYESYLRCSEFTKFNSNFAYVPESKDHMLNATCQAFSHYTWVRSGKQLVVCDLQGKKIGSTVILTDPAIHDSVSVLYHGATNLGEKGIEQFFRLHKCNDICRAMQLERPSE